MADDNMDMDSRKRKLDDITPGEEDTAETASKKVKVDDGALFCQFPCLSPCKVNLITLIIPFMCTASGSDDATDKILAIRKQIEFYFSDSNLPRDRHLLELYQQNNGCTYIVASPASVHAILDAPNTAARSALFRVIRASVQRVLIHIFFHICSYQPRSYCHL